MQTLLAFCLVLLGAIFGALVVSYWFVKSVAKPRGIATFIGGLRSQIRTPEHRAILFGREQQCPLCDHPMWPVHPMEHVIPMQPTEPPRS